MNIRKDKKNFMFVTVTSSKRIGSALFADIGDFETLSDWMIELMHSDTQYKPKTVKIIHKICPSCSDLDRVLVIKQDGKYHEDVPELIEQVCSLPKKLQALPNDHMVIRADGDKKDLIIELYTQEVLDAHTSGRVTVNMMGGVPVCG